MNPTGNRPVAFWAAMAVAVALAGGASRRTWTDASGKHKTEATLVDVVAGKVTLRKPDGKEVKLPIDKLSKVDQEYLAGIATSVPGPAEKTIRGRVTKVEDGDTITVTTGGKDVTVRLHGIDCPEGRQPFADAATDFTRQTCMDKDVVVEMHGTDRYGRTLGSVTVGHLNVSRAAITAGFAWWFHEYSDDVALAKEHMLAREASRGLWKDARPVSPWQWRGWSKKERDEWLATYKSQDAPRQDGATSKPLPFRPQPLLGDSGATRADRSAARQGALAHEPTAEGDESDQTVYMTETGTKYHTGNCRHLRKSRIPISLQEAKRRGLNPCSMCRPPG